MTPTTLFNKPRPVGSLTSSGPNHHSPESIVGMALKTGVSAGPLHKNLTHRDLEIFHTNLVRTREMALGIEAAFQRLDTRIQSLDLTGLVALAVDPIKREVRRHRDLVESAMQTARSREDISAIFIQEVLIGDALAAINEGLIALGEFTKPFLKLRDRLNDLVDTKNGTIVADSLQALGFEKEIEAWDVSVNEWIAYTTTSTLKASELLS